MIFLHFGAGVDNSDNSPGIEMLNFQGKLYYATFLKIYLSEHELLLGYIIRHFKRGIIL